MPININGELYNLQKIEELTKEKLEIGRKVEELLRKLKDDHLNDEQIELKQLHDMNNVSKMIDKIPRGETVADVKKVINGELKVMFRDMHELKEELVLTDEIHTLLRRLVEITHIEEEYFQTHWKNT